MKSRTTEEDPDSGSTNCRRLDSVPVSFLNVLVLPVFYPDEGITGKREVELIFIVLSFLLLAVER